MDWKKSVSLNTHVCVDILRVKAEVAQVSALQKEM